MPFATIRMGTDVCLRYRSRCQTRIICFVMYILLSSVLSAAFHRAPLPRGPATSLFMSDWGNFKALDEDDEDDIFGTGNIDTTEYATENDSQDMKMEVGSALPAPVIDRPAEPIQVPAGSQLELTEETVLGVLSACRTELGTLFGYSAENRGVAITGGVDYVELDGPTVVLRLKGRFWHERTTVLLRVANYLQQRIPEIVDVTVEDPWQLTEEANEVW